MIKKFFQLSMVGLSFGAFSQQVISLDDMSAFQKTESNWRIAGNVSADPTQINDMQTTPGKGVLVCIHPKGTYGNQFDLLSNFQHGDLDLSLDITGVRGENIENIKLLE